MTYLATQLGFIALTIVFFYLLLNQFKAALLKTNWSEDRQKKFFNRLVTSLIVWAVFVSIWSLSGLFGRFDLFPLNAAPVLVIPLISTLLFTFSKSVKDILIHLPQFAIVRLQVFRFFVEILLWALFIDKLLPVQMTFEGRNFDILSGITAPAIALLVSQNKFPRALLIGWNLICMGLLINIVTVAILSMPTPFRYFMNEPVNRIVTQFPISFLPAFLVPLAYGLHFLSLRQLFLNRPAS